MLRVKTGDIITLQNHDSEKSCKENLDSEMLNHYNCNECQVFVNIINLKTQNGRNDNKNLKKEA